MMPERPDRTLAPILRLARSAAEAASAALLLPAADGSLQWWIDPVPEDGGQRKWLESIAREAGDGPLQVADVADALMESDPTLHAFVNQRVAEPTMSYEALLKDLKAHGKL